MSVFDLSQILGGFGEFFGAIAVIVTLVYLSIQVRQNSKLIRHQNHLSSSDQMTKFMALAAASPQLADVFVRGRKGSSDLTEGEQLQFDMALALHLTVVEFHVRASDDVAYDPDAPAWLEIVKYFLDNPGGVEFWRGYRGMFYPEFMDWVEGELSFLEAPEQIAVSPT
jgi:hypothetical protein